MAGELRTGKGGIGACTEKFVERKHFLLLVSEKGTMAKSEIENSYALSQMAGLAPAQAAREDLPAPE